MKRIFIAVNLMDDFKEKIAQLQKALNLQSVRWVKTNIIHLTLCFLGETKDDRLKMIGDSLREIAKEFHPFAVKFKNLGVFPHFQRPRVIWVGVESSELVRLGQSIQDEMRKLGFQVDDRKFSPHLTIGRIRFGGHELSNKIEDLVKEYQGRDFGQARVEKIELMESILQPEGPEYKTLEKCQFLISN